MAKYKVTGKVSKPELGAAGTVTASKIVDAASESEAISKAKAKWQGVYDYIIKDGNDIMEIKVAAI
ncbi:MAG: hypothetical protein K2J64_07770 [Desulfovibrio sp.]|nr:hypothetical protein [Desulfovibrio sp.]